MHFIHPLFPGRRRCVCGEAEKWYRISRRNCEAAQESYRISQLCFENGDLTSQELFIEQERLSQVQLAYIDSYITYRLSVADPNRKTMYDFEHGRSYLPEKTAVFTLNYTRSSMLCNVLVYRREKTSLSFSGNTVMFLKKHRRLFCETSRCFF